MLLDYIVNLSIFSLMVSIPLVIRSFINHKPIKYKRLWGGIYGGIVSIILVMLSIHQHGYSYDIRYASIILIFAYLGPVAGLITGSFAIIFRLYSSGQWPPAIIGWLVIMASFILIHFVSSRFSTIKKLTAYFGAYSVIYIITVPGLFNVFRDKPLFHFQYILFVLLGVIFGCLLIESYMKLYRLNSRLSEMYKMVEESETKYRLIADNTSDLIMLMTKAYETMYFSPSHQLVLGYDDAELKTHCVFSYVHPEDVGLFKRTLEDMIENKGCSSIEFRLHHKDGRWIEFESRCVPVKGERDSVEYFVIISRDISERKKSEEILLQSEKLSIVGELAAGVAHEIRNPLTTIKGFIQLNRIDEGSTEYNDLLLSELARIETITSELLSLGKPQAVRLTRTNLQDLIEYTVDLLSPQALMNNIQFNCHYEGNPIFVTCEQNQIKQVCLNILKNAMEAMKEVGDIDISLKKISENECVISFQDQGCGIPEELLPRLGEPFYSLKEKGTGLGLMICHKIIKQHNGSITYKSKLNEGTLIEIKLPLTS